MTENVFKIKGVYKLVDDLQEGLVTNVPFVGLDFEEINTTERFLCGQYRNNLYIIESNVVYYIELEESNHFNFPLNKSALLYYGLFFHFDKENKKLFIFNATNNQVFIEDTVNFLMEE